MDRSAARPVIGMLPRALKVNADGLSRERVTFPMPIASHRPAAPERATDELSLSGATTGIHETTASIPRVAIENYPRCENAELLGPAVHDRTRARTRVEALNGRLIVRSRVEVGQHRCELEMLGTHDLTIELRCHALTRDLVALENSVRGVEQEGLHAPQKATLELATVRSVHRPLSLGRPKPSSRLVGPKLRIPLPEVEQPR